MAARPKMLICYLCGREYGSKSLPIHIPQCQKKWLAEEEQKPPKERRPLPQPPAEVPIATTSGTGTYNVDAFNDAAYAQWEGSLEQCPHCERRFRPEAYKHHQKSCTAQRPAKKAGTGLTPASLSNRLPPGLISGTARGSKQASSSGSGAATLKVETDYDRASGRLFQTRPNLVDFRTNWQADVPKCDKCSTPYARADSKFCSECGAKRETI